MSDTDTTSTEAVETETVEAEDVNPLDAKANRVGALHEAHAKYILDEFGVVVDPLHIFLTYSTRNKFRKTDSYKENVKASIAEEREIQRLAAEEAKAVKAQERATAAAEKAAAKVLKDAERAKAAEEKTAAAATKAAEKEAAAAAKAAETATDEGETKTTPKRSGKAPKAESVAGAPF
jgi:hypothetical protein